MYSSYVMFLLKAGSEMADAEQNRPILVTIVQNAAAMKKLISTLLLIVGMLTAYPQNPPLSLNLTTTPNNDVNMNWTAPIIGDPVELTWSSDTNNFALGVSSNQPYFVAARWEPGNLIGFDGFSVYQVEFFAFSAVSSYTIKIWQGEDADSLVYSQPISSIVNEAWNLVTLNDLIAINISSELWIGLEITQPEEEFPIGLDFGPAVVGYGDLVNLNGNWETLFSYGLNFNISLKAFLVEVSGEPQPLTKQDFQFTSLSVSPSVRSLKEPKLVTIRAERDINDVPDFYRVYRNEQLIGTSTMTSFTDPLLPAGVYQYGVTAVYDTVESNATSASIQVGVPLLELTPQFVEVQMEADEQQDFVIQMANNSFFELIWSVESKPDFVELSSQTDTIAENESITIIMTIDAAELVAGVYQDTVFFAVNNPFNPIKALPISLTVSGDGLLSFGIDILDFGMVPVNLQSTKQVSVYNYGSETVYIFSTYSDQYYFQPYFTSYEVFPGDSSSIIVSFLANDPGDYEATLSVEVYSQNFETFEILELPMIATASLPAPSSLTATVSNDTVQLNWFPPGFAPGLLQFGNGEPFSALGFNESGTLEAAHKFSPLELMSYSGQQLTDIGFYAWEDVAAFTIKVYKGTNAELLLLEQTVDSIIPMSWNDIALSTPILIDPTDFLWIGYEMVQTQYGFPAGADSGPAVDGSGNLISVNGGEWTTLVDYVFNFNWNIRGLVSEGNSKALLGSQSGVEVAGRDSKPALAELVKTPVELRQAERSTQNELLGFNVYRNGLLLNDSVILENNYLDVLEFLGTFTYEVTAVYPTGESFPATVTIGVDSAIVMPQGWEFTPTQFVHSIHIPVETSMSSGDMLAEGDMVGVFYMHEGQEFCAGAVRFDGNHMLIRAYGDDPETSVKEGFTQNELLYWKAYKNEAAEEHPLQVSYNPQMPQHDGTFSHLGLSELSSMEMVITGLESAEQLIGLTVFPNPTSGLITMTGLENGDEISILDAQGRKVYAAVASGSSITTQIQKSGFYMVITQRTGKLSHQKLIVY